MAKYSEAQNQASQRYQKKAYDTFLVRVKKGEKEAITKQAEKKGLSLNAYILKLIDDDRNNTEE